MLKQASKEYADVSLGFHCALPHTLDISLQIQTRLTPSLIPPGQSELITSL